MSVNKHRIARALVQKLQQNYDMCASGNLSGDEIDIINSVICFIEDSVSSECISTLEVDDAIPQPDSDSEFSDSDEDESVNDDETCVLENDVYSLSQNFSQISCSASPASSGSSYHPTPEKRQKIEPIDEQTIAKIIEVMKQNPNWTYRTYQQKYNITERQFYRIKKKVVSGDFGYKAKLKNLDQSLYAEFIDQRKIGRPIHDHDLQQMALKIGTEMQFENFIASLSFIARFKKRHHIGQRKILHFRTKVQIKDWDKIRQSGKQFVLEINCMLPEFDPNFVFNTDQTGFSLESRHKGTLEIKGTRDVVALAGKADALKNMFTAMPTITISGKMTPILFIVLREASGIIPKSKKNDVNRLVEKLGNVFVTANKTGKMSYPELDLYLKHCLFPFINEKSLLCCDSWTPFLKKNNFISGRVPSGKSLEVMNIPGKTTAECQPLDRGFFRTLKCYIKRISDYSLFDENFKSKLHDRLTIIKLQSFAQNQFSSPRFETWLQHSWSSCGYDVPEQLEICNPYKFAFNFSKVLRYCNVDECEMYAFIRCNWCCKLFCFSHFFYDNNYHFATCNSFTL